ncbi:WD40-repeat-containing domain protein, partial [Piptocephalis cylindrospora]
TKLRILSLDWSPSGNTLITGSADSSVRKWDVSTGHVLERMSVGRTASHRTMVCGDSAGRVIIWDGKTHTALETFQKHKADVLALTVSPDGKFIFSTGVDRTIVRYSRTGAETASVPPLEEEEEDVSYVVSGVERPHQHDVRALAMSDRSEVDALVSGGMDVQIRVGSVKAFDRDALCHAQSTLANPPKNTVNRLLPLSPQSPLVHLVPARHWLLSRSNHSLDLWALDSEEPSMPGEGKRRRLPDSEEGPSALPPKHATPNNRLLLHAQLQGTRHLTASAISEDGNWLAVADPHLVRLFRVVQSGEGPGSGETVSLRKQKAFPGLTVLSSSVGASQYLLLTPDSTKLIIGTTGGHVTIVDLSEWEAGSFPILASWKLYEGSADSSSFATHSPLLRGIGGMRVSGDGAWLAVTDLGHHLWLYNLDALKRHAIIALTRSQGPVAAMLFKPDSSSLYVVQTGGDGRVSEYDVEKRVETDWSRRSSNLPLPASYAKTRDAVLGMSMDPDHMDRLILWGQGILCQVILDILPSKNAKITDTADGQSGRRKRSGKRKKGAESTGESASVDPMVSGISGNYAIIHKYGPMLFMGHMGPGKGVVVERPRWSLLEGAPPAFYTKKFGR